MNRENHFLKSVVSNESLYSEPLPGVPLIEICDQRRVLIENHQGLIAYGCNEIQVKVRSGCVCVSGDHLKLAKMSREKLVITGRICAVNLRGRG